MVVNDDLDERARQELVDPRRYHVRPESEADLIKPRLDNLLEQVDSHYACVLVAAKRARQINSYYHNLGEGTFDEYPPPMVETGSKNYLKIALDEVAAGQDQVPLPRLAPRTWPMARMLLGVSGGIAAYKAVELVRLATKAGHAVRVVQTPASLRFVGRATFEGITGAPVLVDEFEPDPARGAFPGDPAPDHAPISHLELVRRADAFVIAPASANTLAKLAGGQADNLLTSAALACTAPLVLAPAMNNHMWEHPATRANVETAARARRRYRGARRPARWRRRASGARAGWPSRPTILRARWRRCSAGGGRAAGGLRVLVTAGGTREPIDSVRYVGNRSSGRMGVALAAEAAARGAEVTLVGRQPGAAARRRASRVAVETAAELSDAVEPSSRPRDVLLMAAAVADFRPAAPAAARSRRSEPRRAHGRARADRRRAGRRSPPSAGRTRRWWASPPSTARAALERPRQARAQGPRRRRAQRHLASQASASTPTTTR